MSIDPAKRLRHWREIRGLSQRELARRAEMSFYKLNRIENGAQEPRAKDVESLVGALGLTMVEFYGGDDDEARAS